MDKILAIGAILAGVVCFLVLGILLLRVTEKTLPLAERTLRMRKTGTLIAALALAWCVPQIEAVAWRALVPWVWILAIAAIILAYLYLDNLMARGVAGLFIMGAYSFVQLSFAHHLATGVIGAIAAWSWGIAGIVIAGKPCWLRDYFRVAAKRPALRIAVSIYSMLTAVILIWAAFDLWEGWK